ncbi:MAG: hypothetical protein HY925_01035, partial [Elusimicrobia bacterium]|nr:hypothetical protein [Elusimicrobiota bacterium]
MSQEPVEKKDAAAQGSDPGGLSAFVLALREALLGMPPAGAEAADLRAEVARLQTLAKRLEVREADLDEAKKKVLGPWQKLLEEALPKLKSRLDAPGLQNVFEFQGLLEQVRKKLEAPMQASLPEGLQAQEVARLQAEVVRLLESRRRAESEAPPLKARVAELEAQVTAAQEQLQRQARETAEARSERETATRELEIA